MRERIVFKEDDRIAVVAPHPDDECLGAAAPLILAPERTDIYVLTDGNHGNPDRSIEEEAGIRRAQFEAEMEAVKPHAWKWLGYEDTTLMKMTDYAGPGGTIPEACGNGINGVMIQKSLRFLKEKGFQYAVCGSVSMTEKRILERIVDVVVVEDSIDAFGNLLRR